MVTKNARSPNPYQTTRSCEGKALWYKRESLS